MSRIRLWYLGFFFLLTATALPPHADNSAPRPICSAPYASKTPTMTADPTDPAWAKAAVIPDLSPCLTDKPSDRSPSLTSMRLLWSNDDLYIRFICVGSSPYSMAKKHDDEVYKGDAVEAFLDVKGDSRQWIEIEVSPGNISFDQVTTLTADPVSDANLLLKKDILNRDWWPDRGWNLDGLRTASRIIGKSGKVTGWVIDLALPAKPTLHRLGLTAYQPMTLRANFLRVEWPRKTGGNAREFVASDWSPVLLGCPHLSPAGDGVRAFARKARDVKFLTSPSETIRRHPCRP